MKNQIVFGLLIFAITASKSEAASTARALDRFLASAMSDFKVTLQERNETKYGPGAGMNPIEGIQVRAAQNETIEDRKFTLRIKPKGFNQMKLMGSLNAGAGRLERLNSQKAITDALLERYLAAVEYLNASESFRIWTDIASLRSKKMSMLQAAARSSTSRAADLIGQREKVEESEIEQSFARSHKLAAAAKLKALDPSFTELESEGSDLPTPSEMLKVIAETTSASFNGNLATEEAQRAGESIKYETAKDSRLIEFVELSYDQFNFGKQYGFRVALNVPGFSGADSGQSEKARTLLKFEVEAREAQRADQTAQAEARESLSQAAELYKAMEALEKRPSEVRMRRLIGQQDPLLAVTLKEDLLKRGLRRIEVAAKAFESYFDFLATSGALAVRSKTNFLSRDLRELPL